MKAQAPQLARPDVEALVAAAIARAKRFPSKIRRKLIIRSISAKQRPRRKPES